MTFSTIRPAGFALILLAGCAGEPARKETAVGPTVSPDVGVTVKSRRCRRASDPWSRKETTIAVGAVDSDIHKADILILTSPPVPNGTIDVTLISQAAYRKDLQTQLRMLPVVLNGPYETGRIRLDGRGRARAVLRSSDRANSWAIVKAGNGKCRVRFVWSNYEDKGCSEEPAGLKPGSTRTELSTYMLDDVPLDGHRIKFYVEKVLFVDKNGKTHEYEDPADKPRDLSAYAYYKPQTVLTDKDGVARTTLHLPDEHVKSWILCHQTSYDLSARKRMGRYHKPVPEHELQADYRTSFTYFTLERIIDQLDEWSDLKIELGPELNEVERGVLVEVSLPEDPDYPYHPLEDILSALTTWVEEKHGLALSRRVEEGKLVIGRKPGTRANSLRIDVDRELREPVVGLFKESNLRGVVEFLDVNSNLKIKLDEKLDGGRLHLTLTSPHDFGRNRVTLKEFLDEATKRVGRQNEVNVRWDLTKYTITISEEEPSP